MLILEGFSRHVKLNSEKLKEKFVKSKSDIIVITQEAKGDKNINQISNERWGKIFKDFIGQSKQYIDGTVLHLFTPYFSTTTTDIEYSSQIAIISIVNPFLKFVKKFKEPEPIGGCGFPYIKLQGTLQDYKQLKMKIEGLKGYLIDDWISKIIPIIDKIIETKNGKIDYQFWDNIITNQKRVYTEKILLPSSDSHIAKNKEKIEIFGWIFDFFPFEKKQKTIKREYPIIYKEYTLERNKTKIYNDPNFAILPEEMLDIDSIYRNGKGQTASLGIKTGFLGYSINKNSEFKPEIGWYFYVKNDLFNLIK